MSIDRMSPTAVTWRYDAEREAALALKSGEAARDFRHWADEHRAEGNDVLADDCDRLAIRLEQLYANGVAS